MLFCPARAESVRGISVDGSVDRRRRRRRATGTEPANAEDPPFARGSRPPGLPGEDPFYNAYNDPAIAVSNVSRGDL
jgi:hypothetical protein